MERNQRSIAAVVYRRWYKTARWRARRREQLARQPLCEFCLARSVITPATVADHKVRHRGDAQLFWCGELQSLCSNCHDTDKQRMEHGSVARPTVDADGWPADKA